MKCFKSLFVSELIRLYPNIYYTNIQIHITSTFMTHQHLILIMSTTEFLSSLSNPFLVISVNGTTILISISKVRYEQAAVTPPSALKCLFVLLPSLSLPVCSHYHQPGSNFQVPPQYLSYCPQINFLKYKSQPY